MARAQVGQALPVPSPPCSGPSLQGATSTGPSVLCTLLAAALCLAQSGAPHGHFAVGLESTGLPSWSQMRS